MNRITIERSDIKEMEKLYRVNFINSLPGYKSLNLVGTTNSEGQTNLSIVSTVTHFGSNPPILGYVSRPDSVDRHTLSNIREMGQYTFNHVSKEFYQEAHQTSARYPREVSEFDAVGLTPAFEGDHPAPFVAEAKISIYLQLIDTVDIKANGTVLVLGEITNVIIEDALIQSDGYIDLDSAGTMVGSALDGYHVGHKETRLSYAKTNRPISEI